MRRLSEAVRCDDLAAAFQSAGQLQVACDVAVDLDHARITITAGLDAVSGHLATELLEGVLLAVD